MKEFAGLIAVTLSIIGYIPYIRDILKGKTKPHAFSWIVWTLITFIVAVAQIAAGAGWGAIHNLVTGLICLVIVYFALKLKDTYIANIDVYLFVAALGAIPLWVITKAPLYSIVLITVIDVLAFLPTLRKSWIHPTSETLSSYTIAGAKYVFSIFAITTYSVSTLIYPTTLILMNIALVLVLYTRRPQL